MLALMRTGAVAASLLSLAPLAGAAPFGAGVDMYRATCTTFCVSAGSVGAGGDAQLSASASLLNGAGQAGSSAYADLTSVVGSLMLPSLGAQALGATSGSPGQDYFSFARAVTADGYTYTGTTPQSFTLEFLLEGSVSPAAGNPFGDASVSAAVYLFGAQNFEYRQLLSTILYEDMPTVVAGTEVTLPATGNFEQVLGALNFTLQPGESVVLFAHVIASTTGVNTAADAFQTLTFSFSDASGLANTRTIPEPEVSLLLTVGLGGLAGFARMRRTRGPCTRLP